MTKSELRKKLLDRRDKLTAEEVQEKSLKIRSQLNLIPKFSHAETIMFYVSYNNEVDTHSVIKELLGKKFGIMETDGTILLLKEIFDFVISVNIEENSKEFIEGLM